MKQINYKILVHQQNSLNFFPWKVVQVSLRFIPDQEVSLDLTLILYPLAFYTYSLFFCLFSIHSDAHYVISNSALLLPETIELPCDTVPTL